MPLSKIMSEAGVFSASEVALIARVFDALHLQNSTALDREEHASRIIADYQSGITDEAELVRRAKDRSGR